MCLSSPFIYKLEVKVLQFIYSVFVVYYLASKFKFEQTIGRLVGKGWLPPTVWASVLASNTSLRNKSLRARNKVAYVQLLRRDARLAPRYAVTATYGNRKLRIPKIFSAVRKKKSKTMEQFYNNDFQNVVVSNSIPDALSDLHSSKCKIPHNRPHDACLWKPA